MIVLLGCEVKPDPIVYGRDACAFCQMNIVDQAYGSELVTSKGKVFKFDAVECLINYQNQNNVLDEDLSFKMVNAFDARGEFVHAEKSMFLRSPKLPSPMGKFITPFKSHQEAEVAQSQYGGKLYSWSELANKFDDLPNIAE
jgi:copper chaperone NosL